jgi:GNAT superfamily N-acetyltransferase
MTTPTTPPATSPSALGLASIVTLTADRPADPETGIDVDAVGGLLATAFDEPVTRWLVPETARHHPVMAALFTLMAGDALAGGGWVDVLTLPNGQPAGAAIWFNHATASVAEPVEGPDPRLDEVFGPDAGRWRTLDQLMTAHHLAGLHLYLFAVGVLPDHQGHGYGGHLLAQGHQRQGGVPAYLEATSTDSRRLYHRHCYADLGRIDLPDGPCLWRMQLIPEPVKVAR